MARHCPTQCELPHLLRRYLPVYLLLLQLLGPVWTELHNLPSGRQAFCKTHDVNYADFDHDRRKESASLAKGGAAWELNAKYADISTFIDARQCQAAVLLSLPSHLQYYAFCRTGELYPTGVRTTAHGISAGTAKVGALWASVWFNYLNSRTKFWTTASFNFGGLMLTALFMPDPVRLPII
jgi:hypothetical protein